VLVVITSGASTTMVKSWFALFSDVSNAVTPKVKEPVTEGVPVIAPSLDKLSPGGRLPLPVSAQK
jgi:hypothetical protein